MTLDEYIEQELNKPPTNAWYDPDGSSSRAVMVRMRKRGILSAMWWECRQIPEAIGDIKCGFDGWETPIAWFCQLITAPFVLPFLPFWATYWRYQRALADYRAEWRVEEHFKLTQKR